MSYYTRLELQRDDADYKGLSRSGEQGLDPQTAGCGHNRSIDNVSKFDR